MPALGLRAVPGDVGAEGRLLARAGRPSSEALERYLDAAGVRLEPGWHAEVNLAALAWVARAALALHRGFLLLIDYGHPAPELYSAAHAAGTLTTYRRHVADARQSGTSAGGPPWLDDPGGQDITSHVDLTSVQRTAEELGCATLGVLDQTYFLLALGAGDRRSSGGTTIGDIKRRLAFKTLLMPGGLGSTHKVMVFARGLGTPELLGLSGGKRVT
jgi:SAM-dependent MidA family methyltransferase